MTGIVSEPVEQAAATFGPVGLLPVAVRRVLRPEALEPGDVLIHRARHQAAVIRKRKVGSGSRPFPGWWVDGLKPGGGLADYVIERGDWLLLYRGAPDA